MRYIIYGKNLEVTEGLKQAVHDKFSKLEKFFTPETEVQVTLSVQKDNQIVEATIPMKGTILRVEPNSTDMYVSIDMAVDLLERMIRKYKTKISKYGKGELKFNDEFMEEDVDNHETVTITKSKKFAIKPMDVEEACVQMELLGHNFFVFRNAETFEVNVVSVSYTHLPVATCIFQLRNNGAAISSGMGTAGLVGPIGIITGWSNMPKGYAPGAFDWVGMILVCFILPVVLSWAIGKFMRKKGWIKEGDLKVDLGQKV